jgi:hypothetical protein
VRSFHGRFWPDFTTTIAESDFRLTQAGPLAARGPTVDRPQSGTDRRPRVDDRDPNADRHVCWPGGSIGNSARDFSGTLGLLVLGLSLGCSLAWKRMHQTSATPRWLPILLTPRFWLIAHFSLVFVGVLLNFRRESRADCLRNGRLLDSRDDYVAGAKNCSPKIMMPIAAIQLPLARSAMARQLPLPCRNAIAQAIVNVMVTYPIAVTPEMNSR